jgi:hypothetical protein
MSIAFVPLNLITAIAPMPGAVAKATIVSFQLLIFSRIHKGNFLQFISQAKKILPD